VDRPIRRWPSSLVVLLVVAAACGGDDETASSEAPVASSAPTTVAAVTTATTSTTASTSTAPATTSTAPTTTSASTTTTPATTTTSTTEPAPASTAAPAGLAVPDETDLTVFFRLAESVLEATDSAYVGTPPEVLVEAAQASCRVLLAGGDVRSAIEAAIASSPVAGQPFGVDEQQFTLLVVTRGAALWCPDVVGDPDAFTSEVILTIVDVFFEG